jgi:hypothetical protein
MCFEVDFEDSDPKMTKPRKPGGPPPQPTPPPPVQDEPAPYPYPPSIPDLD